MKPSHRRWASVLFVASVALCVAIAGVGYAAAAKVDTRDLAKGAVTAKKLDKNAVTTKKIKKRAVNGSKVADDSLTGKQIDESTLGLVPSANHANTANNANTANQATNADNATHADTADTAANGAVEFKFFAPTGGSADILTVPGARFSAACSATNVVSATANGTAPGNGIVKAWGVNESGTAWNNNDDNFDPGDTLNILDGANPETGANLAFAGDGGNPTVTATYASEDDGTLAPGADCMIWGTANVL